MSLPRIRFRNRLKFDEKDYHKRYAGSSVSIGYRGNELHDSGRIARTTLSYLHEVGDPLSHYPARPFILQSIRGVKGVERIRDYMRTQNASRSGLYKVVESIVADCIDYVKAGNITPALKQSTIKRKKQNKEIPLVETEDLINHLEGWVSRWKK